MTQVTLDFVRQCLPIRARDGHKGTFGKVHILAGSVGFTGAPALAASGAVRTGSGLVYLWVDRAIWPVLALKCQSAMPAPVPPFGAQCGFGPCAGNTGCGYVDNGRPNAVG